MNVDVVFAASADYLPYTAVAAASVCRHLRKGNTVVFHVLHDGGVDAAGEAAFRDGVRRFANIADIVFYRVEDRHNLSGTLFTSDHIKGSATYHRLAIPELFSGKLSRVLYLDSDLIVCDDITKLFEIDMGDKELAGVSDTLSVSMARSLCLPETARYVNGGVLVWNLEKISVSRFNDALAAIARGPRKYLIKFGDQDVLGIVFHNTTHLLPREWNVLAINAPGARQLFVRRCLGLNNMGPDELAASVANPSIIHYVGEIKPWQRDPYYDALSPRWFTYAAMTGYWSREWRMTELYVRFFTHTSLLGGMLYKPFNRAIGKAIRAVAEAGWRKGISRAATVLFGKSEAAKRDEYLRVYGERKLRDAAGPLEPGSAPGRTLVLAHDGQGVVNEAWFYNFIRLVFKTPMVKHGAGKGALDNAGRMAMYHASAWRDVPVQARMARKAAEGADLWFVDSAFVASILDDCLCRVTPIRYRRVLAFLVDDCAFHHDRSGLSRLQAHLASDASRLDDAAIRRAREAMRFIVANRLSKHNHLPLDCDEIPGDGRKKVLVVDQDRDDDTLRQGDGAAFSAMLKAARADNPGADIYVTLPRSGLRARGHFARVREAGATLLTRRVNPYGLFPLVGRVYVFNDAIGLDALLAGKPVVAFGPSIYAGWGLTDDRNGVRKKAGSLTPEELFHGIFLVHTRYFSPDTAEELTLEAFLREMVSLRDDFFAWKEEGLAVLAGNAPGVDARTRICPPIETIKASCICPVCRGKYIFKP